MNEFYFVYIYLVTVVALLGLCMGSFLNCLSWRMVHGGSVLSGRSHCPSCGHVLSFRDLVPILSWVTLKGKCRYCGSKISARYPLTEAVCAIMFASLVIRYGFTLEAVELMAFGGTLLVLSLTDIDSYVIPNATIVTAIVVRLAYIGVGGALGLFDAGAMLLGSIVGGVSVALPVFLLSLVMDHVLGHDSLGGGDIKLIFVAGLYFGWQQSLLMLVIACVLGIVMGVLPIKARAKDDDDGEESARLIPFGPAIALACWIVMLVGQPVVEWYLTLFHF